MSSGRTIALDLDHGPIIPPYWTPPPPTGSGKWLHDKPGGLEWAAITPADVGLARPGALNLYGASVGAVSTSEPLINFWNNPDGAGDVLKWQIGLDVANGVNDDLVLAARNYGAGVADFLYVRANPNSLSFGVGYTPPPDKAALAVTGADGSDTRALVIRIGPGTTGDALQVGYSDGTVTFRVDYAGRLEGYHLAPISDPGTISVAPKTPGNSGEALMSYRGNVASGVGIDYVPVGNDMQWVLKTTFNGGAVARFSTFGYILNITPQSDYEALRINAPPGSPVSHLMALVNNANSAYFSGFDKGGRFFTYVHTAPADADVDTGQMFVWFDQTSGAAKMMVKAKDAGGTIRTGSLALA